MLEKYPEILNFIGECPYFVTGSRRFGTARAGSDLDICVPIFKRVELFLKAQKQDLMITESDYNNGFKFIINGVLVNIVPLHHLDYVCWFHATRLTNEIPLKNSLSRTKIHATFQTLIALNKMIFCDEMVTKENYLSFCVK